MTRATLLAAGVTIALGVAHAPAAHANWSGNGDGTGEASVGTLNAPTGVNVSSIGATVTVNWTGTSPPQGTLTGYTVTRYAGSTPSNACGTDPANSATFLPAGTTTCNDTSVPDGTYDYTVTAIFRSWTARSAAGNAISVNANAALPSQSVGLAAGASNAVLVGTSLYYRSIATGSFQIVDNVTSAMIGPASATFPAIGTAGWTHAAETVSAGSGATTTKAYTSSTYAWASLPSNPSAHTVTGRDILGNTVNTALSFASDDVGPLGGALTVNGAAASGVGTSSYAKATFTIGLRTDYSADAGSGTATSVLSREPATLINNACGTFGSATVIAGTPSQSGLTTGCYRYTLTGTDNVGNTTTISTTVKYDVALPTQAITLSAGDHAAQTGNVIYYRTTTAGSFVLTDAVTDNESGPASATFPVISTVGWTHPVQTVSSGTGSAPTIVYPSSTYSFGAGASTATTTIILGNDLATNQVSQTMTLTKDITAPTVGKLTVNAVAGSAGGSTSFNKTGSATISLRTDYTDATAGIASSVLTVASATLGANTCGTFGTPSTIVGSPTQTGLTTGCYKYILTGTDRVGNVASLTTTVKVDLVAPTGGAVTVNGLAAATASTTSLSNSAGGFPIDSRTDYSDAESGLLTSTLSRTTGTLLAGICGTLATPVTQVGTPAQTGLTTGCWKYTLTGTDSALNAPAVSTIVKYDLVAPTAGALTVNGVAASAIGTTSAAAGPSFTIGTRTANTDANSGLSSTILNRQFGTLTGSTCGSFGSPTAVVGTTAQTGLATGCYLYTLIGTDLAGNTVAISTTVKLGVYASAVSLINGTGVAGRADAGDQIVITFSDQMGVTSMCSAWSGNSSDQAITGDNEATVSMTNGGAGNDTISVSSSLCTFNIGGLNLGGTTYTTANVTYGGTGANKSTIVWNWAQQKLTITLGLASGAGPATVTSSIVTYTPSITMLNAVGDPAGSSFPTALVKQF